MGTERIGLIGCVVLYVWWMVVIKLCGWNVCDLGVGGEVGVVGIV